MFLYHVGEGVETIQVFDRLLFGALVVVAVVIAFGTRTQEIIDLALIVFAVLEVRI